MLQQYIPNVLVVSVVYCSKCFLMLQLFYLDVAYVFHTHVASICPKCFYLFQMYVAFECFMLQVQIADVGVHEGRQG
jgi:hypothetical protein